MPEKATCTNVPAPSDHLYSRKRSCLSSASGLPLLMLDAASTSLVSTVLYPLIFASPLASVIFLKICAGFGLVILSYTYMSRIPPVPWLRTVTSACKVETPIKLAQFTLSTLEEELVGMIGSQ